MTPDPRQLSIHDFTYSLPADRIAPEPLPDRAASRLLVSRANQLTDKHFRDLPGELPPGALLIFNDTRVVRARLLARRPTGGQVELFCLEPVAPHRSLELALQQTGHCTWRCLVGNGRRWKEGPVTLEFTAANGQTATLWAERQVKEAGAALLDFRWEPAALPFAEVLRAAGHLPLPPYIRGSDVGERYQTVYSREKGSVAAPTAGLHFTPELLERLDKMGVERHFVTLHVGAGTFKPISGPITNHQMHEEVFSIPVSTADAINRAKLEGRRIVAVGTTTVRALESAVSKGQVQAGEGATSIFIVPPYRFQIPDLLITNFHLPNSSLMLLVGAFAGEERIKAAYFAALERDYRFYSLGDAMLIFGTP